MNRSHRILEFDKILERLSGYTSNESVKKKIMKLSPHKSMDAAKQAQKETTEAVITMLKLGAPAVSLSVKDIRPVTKKSEMGGVLHPDELLAISRVLYVSRYMKGYLSEISDECTVFMDMRERIMTRRQLEDKINAAIISEEEIADDASAELAAIRRRIKGLNARIRETLNDMIRSSHYKKYLQDPIVTMRSDRFVIPVKSEYKNEVPGIVHDSSASGATLFVEPMSVVKNNNEIRDLKGREQAETERILAELSAAAANEADALFENYAIVSELDFIFCKGRLSLDMSASEPILNDEGRIVLKKARHPLIDKDKVVANDIELGKDFDTLVVTGPNTGGKTVTLKTVGLLSVMAAAGLHITAAQNSEAAVFSKIFADIGDEQSIEQSLSTFSSHMVNIVSILKNVDSNSLALFDELGAGTDPTEGAALAVAVLEHLRDMGVKTVATTHYSELKLFALSADGVENASCEFDVATLRPTYKLLIGIPGKSNAFAISRRLGLDELIISRANDILSDEDIKLEDVISELEQNRRRAKSDADDAKRMKQELKSLKDSLDADRIKLKDNKARILEEARREAKIIVMDAKEEARSVIRDLERLKAEGAKTANLGEQAAKMRDKLNKKESSIDDAMAKAAKPRKTYAEPPKNLRPGTSVKIVDMNQEATVLSPADKNGRVRVQAGIIKLDVHVSNLRLIEEKKQDKKKSGKTVRSFESKTRDVSTEVDVRGQYPEEAWINVEKFIDDCYLAGVSPVSIIHGKGTGVLKNTIRSNLKGYRYVKSFRPGRFGEGEDGVTICELK